MSPRLIILEQLLPGGKKVNHNQLFTSGSHLFCFKEYSKYFQSTYSVYFNRYLVIEIISVSHSVNHLLANLDSASCSTSKPSHIGSQDQ